MHQNAKGINERDRSHDEGTPQVNSLPITESGQVLLTLFGDRPPSLESYIESMVQAIEKAKNNGTLVEKAERLIEALTTKNPHQTQLTGEEMSEVCFEE